MKIKEVDEILNDILDRDKNKAFSISAIRKLFHESIASITCPPSRTYIVDFLNKQVTDKKLHYVDRSFSMPEVRVADDYIFYARKLDALNDIIKQTPPDVIDPRAVHEARRFSDILESIRKYSTAGMPIPYEWLGELEFLYDNKID